MRRRFVWSGTVAVALVAALAAGGCKGGGSSTGGSPTQPTPTPPPTGGGGGDPTSVTITIQNNAVSPQNVTIAQGGRVTFVNNDSRAHDMASDPHPEHTDCPELNQVGFLQPGQQRTSGNLNTVRVCRFHDHNQPSVAGLTGSITIR
ncbi:MAG: hypothetical protein AB1635_05615 [Acidobacteriota bacterium]